MIRNLAVIGAGFGDEGKGLVTNFLASLSFRPLVVRYSGGHNAGHTVYDNNYKHVFSNFGSGTLAGKQSYFSKYCTMNPTHLLAEYETLKENGYNPILYIDKDCAVTTPFDVSNNRKRELSLKHGSVGVGLGSTHQREQDFYSLTFLDILYKNVLEEKLRNIEMYYKSKHDVEVDKDDVVEFLEDCEIIREKLFDENIRFHEGLPGGFDTYIFEGSQGLLLDQHYGFFPNVTRSCTGTKNIFKIINIEPPNLDIWLVTRAYQTRHGNGYMTNENIPHNIKINPDESNVTHKHQGIFRRSLLDVSLLQYAFFKDDYISNFVNRKLVITCLDHVENELRFTFNGKIIVCNDRKDFVKKIAEKLDIRPHNILMSDSPHSTLSPLSEAEGIDSWRRKNLSGG